MISEIDSQIFKITEMKKNEILEKQNKRFSRLRIAGDSSDVSVNKQTNDLPKTAKTITVKDRKKRKHPKEVNMKSLLPYIRLSNQYPTLSQELI